MKLNKKPLVSVVCFSYNQEEYIRQALEGFVMQKTDFPFEVLIHDDASSDSTTRIINEYVEKYPDIIKPIFEKENQYSKGNFEFIFDTYRLSKSKYIAVCEGDDYWTDNSKLQRQVNFLENNPNYSICFHPVRVIIDDGNKKEYIYPDNKPNLSTESLLKKNFIQTNSVMYRRQDYSKLVSNVMPGDIYMHLYHAKFGKIGYINRVMSVYRRHIGGVWWDSDSDLIWKKYGLEHLSLFVELQKMFSENANLSIQIEKSIINMLIKVMEIDKKYSTNMLLRTLERYPDKHEYFIILLYKHIVDKNKLIKKDKKDIEYLESVSKYKDEIIKTRDAQNQHLEHQLTIIHSTIIWKVCHKVVLSIRRHRGRK